MKKFNVGQVMGWKGESTRHSLARRGVKTGRKSNQNLFAAGSNGSKDYHINRHNWGFSREGKIVRVSLGNMSDAGWFWDGHAEDFNGFLVRLSDSKFRDEFLKDMPLPWNEAKALAIASAEKGDGLYEVSGDNNRWHFGNDEVDSEEVKETLQEYGLDVEQAQRAVDTEFWNYYSEDFDQFEKLYGKNIKADFVKGIKESNSYTEYFDKVEGIKQGVAETYYTEYVPNQILEAASKTVRDFKKKVKK
jgi:hypothetical protein